MSKLPSGRYRARILYHSLATTKTCHTQLVITVLPYAGYDSATLPTGYKPKPEPVYMTLTDATMGTSAKPGWVVETLRHLGFEGNDLSTLDPDHECAHSFTGREVVILGSEDVYNNRQRVRWNIMRNVADSKPVAQAALMKLSDRYKDALSALLPKDDNGEHDPGVNSDKPPF